MNVPTIVDGVLRLPVYPQRLGTDDLAVIRRHAREFISPQAPRLGAWLLEFVDGEDERRLSNVCGDCIECSLPSLDLDKWTNPELGKALIASTGYAFNRHMPAVVAELLRCLHVAIASAAGIRLRAQAILPSFRH